ncbi:MAG: hypothetical protein V4719_24925 [Planctomycetota bacterium]
MPMIHPGWYATPLKNTVRGLVAVVLTFQSLPLPAESKPAPLPDGLVLKTPVISEQLTGPFRLLNETLSKGITPSDNAAVFLVQTFGDEVFEPELHDRSLEMLGIATLSPTAPRFAFLETYIKARGTEPPENIRLAAMLLQNSVFAASERVWTREQFVDVSDYLQTNGAALDAIVDLANKPRYFAPVLSPDTPASMLSASKVIERRVPFLARTLSTRALHRIANNDFAGAMTDLMASHKLAELLATGSPLDTSAAQANLADSFAYRAERAILEKGKFTGPQATTYRTALEQLPLLLIAARAADVGERAILHQELELLKGDETAIRGFFEVAGEKAAQPAPPAPLPAIKWDLAMKRADEIQDRIVQALSTRDRVAQDKLFDQLDRDYQTWTDTVDATTRKFASSPELDLEAASKWIGESMAMSLRPLYRQRRATEDRACIRRDMVLIGLALTSFQREHGEYPATLAELAPGYLKSITSEADAIDTLIYVRETPNHVRLLSKGVNRQDDAGKGYNDDEKLELQ